MAIGDFFNHTADVFHIQQRQESPGYGLPASASHSYPDEPDIAGQSCHFSTKGRTFIVKQNTPQADLEARIKVTFPIGTDIRLNDKIIDLDSGFNYTAEAPINIRDHHLVVWVKRREEQKPI